MKIRKAEEKDIPRLLALLEQVLQIHADPSGYFYSRHHQIHCLRTCRAF